MGTERFDLKRRIKECERKRDYNKVSFLQNKP